jgi:hypothetical protein
MELEESLEKLREEKQILVSNLICFIGIACFGLETAHKFIS